MGYRWCYCSGSAVEWASWWNGHLSGTGILVEWASWWNWHLASFNRFWGGQDAHSTVIDPAGNMPTILLLIRRAGCPLYCYSFFSRFPTPYTLHPTPHSRFPKITKPRKEITLQGFMIFYLVAGGGFEPPTFGLCVPTTTFVAWIFQFVVWTVPSPSP
ncbi:MAG: hypothetical protein F6K56_37355 [Moorea sp. SIO3G5]|nr:hypothetical protein [Moorena sp. SIO3G5]